jgi:cell division protein FtsI (penicillin-binding protein 3)
MMEAVTEDGGTAPKARVPGFRVAGKTGTARKVGVGGYDDERHVALFAGIVPVSDPRIVVVVVVNEPKGEARGGGGVAAPVFSRVAARSLRLLGVKPDALTASVPEAASASVLGKSA